MTALRVTLCIACAVLLHASVLLFGGILFPRDQSQHSRRDVELVADDVEQDREDAVREEPPEELQQNSDAPPDPNQASQPEEVVATADDAPALEAASLAAIEQALNGDTGGGGDGFGGGTSLVSGGRIGGTGKAGGGDDDEFQGAFSMSQIDQRPRVVHQVAAGYPTELRSQGLEGTVTLIFIVDDTGRVVNPRVEKSSHTAFEAPALDAVRQWKFEPAIKAGKRVSCRMRAPLRFQPR
jgi:protein TonB